MIIPEATKQGYAIAYDGDSVNLEHPKSNTRRGRVGKQQAQTLTTSCNQGVVIGSTQKNAYVGSIDGSCPSLTSAMGQGGGHIPMIDNPLKDKTQYGWHFEQNVYGEESNCIRTLKSEQESGNQPKVIQKGHGFNKGAELENCPSITSSCWQENNYIANDLIIRKLTPLECWRLMGSSDEQFQKAAKVCSNTQLYKQAGNGIVVNVLEAIFRKLFQK